MLAMLVRVGHPASKRPAHTINKALKTLVRAFTI